ncbi:hypothetical protein HYH03_000161 [Edaphochlamys debaryana]|uniref:Guanylate cyclase domain-containing protein n=1 Tax=Edaphochlamys debaryana TaxID=47281 RepID=A0A836C7D3_9CHLO|nr:hypothetical protein HYH03_000161 [Edaphochlamys debaryana]|eukprot:KAG2501657.1 hypothetical protein HYH03_000161 [Edaphochlamys debaryana]
MRRLWACCFRPTTKERNGARGDDEQQQNHKAPVQYVAGQAPPAGKFLEAMLSGINDPVALFTPHGTLLASNPASAALFDRMRPTVALLGLAGMGPQANPPSLQLLFATDPDALEDALLEVEAGRTWRAARGPSFPYHSGSPAACLNGDPHALPSLQHSAVSAPARRASEDTGGCPPQPFRAAPGLGPHAAAPAFMASERRSELLLDALTGSASGREASVRRGEMGATGSCVSLVAPTLAMSTENTSSHHSGKQQRGSAGAEAEPGPGAGPRPDSQQPTASHLSFASAAAATGHRLNPHPTGLGSAPPPALGASQALGTPSPAPRHVSGSGRPPEGGNFYRASEGPVSKDYLSLNKPTARHPVLTDIRGFLRKAEQMYPAHAAAAAAATASNPNVGPRAPRQRRTSAACAQGSLAAAVASAAAETARGARAPVRAGGRYSLDESSSHRPTGPRSASPLSRQSGFGPAPAELTAPPSRGQAPPAVARGVSPSPHVPPLAPRDVGAQRQRAFPVPPLPNVDMSDGQAQQAASHRQRPVVNVRAEALAEQRGCQSDGESSSALQQRQHEQHGPSRTPAPDGPLSEGHAGQPERSTRGSSAAKKDWMAAVDAGGAPLHPLASGPGQPQDGEGAGGGERQGQQSPGFWSDISASGDMEAKRETDAEAGVEAANNTPVAAPPRRRPASCPRQEANASVDSRLANGNAGPAGSGASGGSSAADAAATQARRLLFAPESISVCAAAAAMESAGGGPTPGGSTSGVLLPLTGPPRDTVGTASWARASDSEDCGGLPTVGEAVGLLSHSPQQGNEELALPPPRAGIVPAQTGAPPQHRVSVAAAAAPAKPFGRTSLLSVALAAGGGGQAGGSGSAGPNSDAMTFESGGGFADPSLCWYGAAAAALNSSASHSTVGVATPNGPTPRATASAMTPAAPISVTAAPAQPATPSSLGLAHVASDTSPIQQLLASTVNSSHASSNRLPQSALLAELLQTDAAATSTAAAPTRGAGGGDQVSTREMLHPGSLPPSAPMSVPLPSATPRNKPRPQTSICLQGLPQLAALVIPSHPSSQSAALPMPLPSPSAHPYAPPATPAGSYMPPSATAAAAAAAAGANPSIAALGTSWSPYHTDGVLGGGGAGGGAVRSHQEQLWAALSTSTWGTLRGGRSRATRGSAAGMVPGPNPNAAPQQAATVGGVGRSATSMMGQAPGPQALSYAMQSQQLPQLPLQPQVSSRRPGSAEALTACFCTTHESLCSNSGAVSGHCADALESGPLTHLRAAAGSTSRCNSGQSRSVHFPVNRHHSVTPCTADFGHELMTSMPISEEVSGSAPRPGSRASMGVLFGGHGAGAPGPRLHSPGPAGAAGPGAAGSALHTGVGASAGAGPSGGGGNAAAGQGGGGGGSFLNALGFGRRRNALQGSSRVSFPLSDGQAGTSQELPQPDPSGGGGVHSNVCSGARSGLRSWRGHSGGAHAPVREGPSAAGSQGGSVAESDASAATHNTHAASGAANNAFVLSTAPEISHPGAPSPGMPGHVPHNKPARSLSLEPRGAAAAHAIARRHAPLNGAGPSELAFLSAAHEGAMGDVSADAVSSGHATSLAGAGGPGAGGAAVSAAALSTAFFSSGGRSLGLSANASASNSPAHFNSTGQIHFPPPPPPPQPPVGPAVPRIVQLTMRSLARAPNRRASGTIVTEAQAALAGSPGGPGGYGAYGLANSASVASPYGDDSPRVPYMSYSSAQVGAPPGMPGTNSGSCAGLRSEADISSALFSASGDASRHGPAPRHGDPSSHGGRSGHFGDASRHGCQSARYEADSSHHGGRSGPHGDASHHGGGSARHYQQDPSKQGDASVHGRRASLLLAEGDVSIHNGNRGSQAAFGSTLFASTALAGVAGAGGSMYNTSAGTYGGTGSNITIAATVPAAANPDRSVRRGQQSPGAPWVLLDSGEVHGGDSAPYNGSPYMHVMMGSHGGVPERPESSQHLASRMASPASCMGPMVEYGGPISPVQSERIAHVPATDTPEAEGGSWFEVVVSGVPHPTHPGETLVLVVQHDVSARVWAELQLAKVVEAEHALLESIFPQHVLEHIALMASASDTGAGAEAAAAAAAAAAEAAAQRGVALAAPPPAAPQHPGAQPAITGGSFLHLATSHSSVSVLFCDIQGFTAMCGVVKPATVMAFLNDLYTRLDAMLDAFGVYKVETIGDCYMVAGGLMRVDEETGAVTVRSDDVDPQHAYRTVQFAKALLRVAATVCLPTTGEPVRLRVGIHSGPAMSGVVGTRMPRFCLFGDTINTASRMESTGSPGAIHVSRETYDLVPGEDWQPTGGVEAKGKGRLQTYLLKPPLDAL